MMNSGQPVKRRGAAGRRAIRSTRADIVGAVWVPAEKARGVVVRSPSTRWAGNALCAPPGAALAEIAGSTPQQRRVIRVSAFFEVFSVSSAGATSAGSYVFESIR